MASVVDTSVKYFDSSMPNAPVLNGVAGALNALLLACLKDGFNTIAPSSIVVAGGIATVAWVGTFAALKDAVVLIGGVTDKPSLNGEQKVITKTATSLTFATAESGGAASGAFSMKMAPAGWLAPYTGTNLLVLQSADPAATKMLLRVDDSGTTVARVVGYEQMSDVNTGVGAFPSAAQMPGGGYWTKSLNANTTAVQWALFADSRYIILHVAPGYSTNAGWTQGWSRGFGDSIPFKVGGDAYCCSLSYSGTATPNNQTDGTLDGWNNTLHAFPRGYWATGSCYLHDVRPYMGSPSVCSGADATFGTFPNPVDGSLIVSRKVFTAGVPRSEIPGILHVAQNNSFDGFRRGDRVPGAGLLAGRNLYALNPTTSAITALPAITNSGASFVDITGPWR